MPLLVLASLLILIEPPQMRHARGTFEVTLAPLELHDSTGSHLLGRMALDKIFRGDLAGTSRGEMLTAMTDQKNSAGYVAIARVTGRLHGREGTFVLQHSGTMTRGDRQLVITVVPDSGTGALAGLAGTMTITITEGTHYYDFSYTLP